MVLGWPIPFSVRNSVILFFASATESPFRKSELTRVPVSTSVNTASFTSTGLPATTSMMGMSNFLANSQSRSSWAGTAMMAPVP